MRQIASTEQETLGESGPNAHSHTPARPFPLSVVQLWSVGKLSLDKHLFYKWSCTIHTKMVPNLVAVVTTYFWNSPKAQS